MLAATGGADVGNFVNLEPVDAAGIGEDQNVSMGRDDEEMLDEILVARLHAGAARASAALHAVGRNGRPLEVAGVADGDCDLLVGNEVFEDDLGGFVFDTRAAVVAVELLHFFELFDDDGAQLFLGAENRFVLGDVVANFLQLVRNFIDRKFGQAMQLQFEDGIGLPGSEGLFGIELGSAPGGVDIDFLAAKVLDQVFAGIGAVGAAANDGDDVVEMVEGSEIAFEDVLAVFRLLQQVSSAAADDVDAVLDEVLNGLDKAHFTRLSVNHREEDHREALLHLRVLEELVEDDLGLNATLQFDDDAHAVAIGFVANIGDVFDFFVVDQRRDALDQNRLVYLIRNLGDDDGLAIFVDVLDGGFGAHHEAPAACAVGFENSGAPVNDSSRREVGALDELQNFRELRVGIIDERDGGVDDLRQIMWRNFRCHANRDSVGTIDKQVRNARGKNVGLDFAAVIVRMEVDSVFVEVFQQRGGNLRKLGFCVTVGCGRISIDGAEVALTENRRIAHRPVLRESDESVIHSEVAVRVVLTHDVSDDAGAFARRAIRIQPHLLHRVENAAMDGLESVANVGERAADDDRHRIVEIRPAHLLFDVDGLNVQSAGAVAAAR